MGTEYEYKFDIEKYLKKRNQVLQTAKITKQLILSALHVLQEDDSLHDGRRRIRGSATRKSIDRNRLEGQRRLHKDYFAENPVYNDRIFRRRFRMRRDLFLHIAEEIKKHDTYFVQKRDAARRLGLSTNQKVTAAIRLLAYGTSADSLDEYLRLAECTAIKCLKRFCDAVIDVFGSKYLRQPNEEDLKRLLAVGESRGFPGMLGSVDCMHWTWKNCPAAWHGQFTGKEKFPTVVLEAVASYDLWIWHAFFGLPGSLNDINVMDRSPIWKGITEGTTPEIEFKINGKQFNLGYYLADGIYPSYATLVKTIPEPQCPKKKHFAKMQEAMRKDVERAFGVLQARFAIVKGPVRFWYEEELCKIMKTCIILHNMIIEDERGEDLGEEYEGASSSIQVSRSMTAATFSDFVKNHIRIRDKTIHNELRDNLIEHLYSRK